MQKQIQAEIIVQVPEWLSVSSQPRKCHCPAIYLSVPFPSQNMRLLIFLVRSPISVNLLQILMNLTAKWCWLSTATSPWKYPSPLMSLHQSFASQMLSLTFCRLTSRTSLLQCSILSLRRSSILKLLFWKAKILLLRSFSLSLHGVCSILSQKAVISFLKMSFITQISRFFMQMKPTTTSTPATRKELKELLLLADDDWSQVLTPLII